METKRARRGAVLLALAALAPALPGWGQQDSDIDMMRQQTGAPPNVMLLFDSSRSMWHVVWSQSTDPKVPSFLRETDYGRECNLPEVPRLGSGKISYDPGGGFGGGGDGFIEATSGDPVKIRCRKAQFTKGDPCGEWETKVPDSSCAPVSVTEWDFFRFRNVTTEYYDFTAPALDTGSNRTWWAKNYLHYLFRRLREDGALPPGFRAETRVQAGKRAMVDLIERENKSTGTGSGNCPKDGTVDSYDEAVRFGLARFSVRGSGHGYVRVPIRACNKRSLLTELNALVSDTEGTPLTAALINMGRYFTGSAGRHNALGTYAPYDLDVSDRSGGAVPESPIDAGLLCQSNFIVYVTDGEPTVDSRIDAADYASTFGARAPLRLDVVSGYLASNDLIPSLPGKQNVPLYTIGFSLDVPLLSDAAKAGQGAYHTAQDAAQLSDKLGRSIEDILLRSATFAVGNVPGARAGAGDLYLRANFHPGPRGQLSEGHLKAYEIGPGFQLLGKGGVPASKPDPSLPVNAGDPDDAQMSAQLFDDGVVPLWDAQDALRDPAHPGYVASRRLLVNLPDPRFSDLNLGLDAGALGLVLGDLGLYPKSLGLLLGDVSRKLIGYTRGEDAFDDDSDGDTAERRAIVLGEIFHSDPLLVSGPTLFLAAEDGYGPGGDPGTFLAQNATRDRVVYAGSADGFLHGFDAGQYISSRGAYDFGTGRELFGFMPASLLPSVRSFARADLPKPLFVDGPPAAADAWIPDPLPAGLGSEYRKKASEWATVLMTGMRGGGRSYLGLDVTAASLSGGHPSGKPFPRFLFEFTHPNLGLTWSKPVLTRVKVVRAGIGDFCGAVDDGDGDCLETWVAIFAGGYERAGDPSQPVWSGPTQSVSSGIYAIELATGKLLAFQPSAQGCSIPAQPAVIDENGDGFSDLAYVGDTCGNLLKWDLSSVGRRAAAEPKLVENWPFGVLFRSPQGAGHYRSFFNSPSVSRIGNKLTIALGTGERTDLDYATKGGDENHLYVIRDPQPASRGDASLRSIPSVPYGLDSLVGLNGKRSVSDPTKLGFYLIGEPNEKFITNPLAFAGRLFLASYTWDAASKASCQPRGSATLIRLNLADGSGDGADANPDVARRFQIGAGLPADPRVSVGKDGTAKVIAMTSSGGGGIGSAPQVNREVEMIYWREGN